MLSEVLSGVLSGVGCIQMALEGPQRCRKRRDRLKAGVVERAHADEEHDPGCSGGRGGQGFD